MNTTEIIKWLTAQSENESPSEKIACVCAYNKRNHGIDKFMHIYTHNTLLTDEQKKKPRPTNASKTAEHIGLHRELQSRNEQKCMKYSDRGTADVDNRWQLMCNTNHRIQKEKERESEKNKQKKREKQTNNNNTHTEKE